MNDNGITTEQAANDNARPILYVVRLCVACDAREAVYDGYCIECIGDADTMIMERRGEWEGDRF